MPWSTALTGTAMGRQNLLVLDVLENSNNSNRSTAPPASPPGRLQHVMPARGTPQI